MMHSSILRARVAAGLIVALLSACRQAVDNRSPIDSAGVRIVINDKPSWTAAQQLRLADTPSVVIGNREEEPYLLSGVRNPLQLSDGRIVLGNSGSSELRVYDAKGTYLHAVGRKGDGPGEFQRIEKIARLGGDTIAVFHGRSDISLFSPSGSFIRKLSAPRATDTNGRPTSITMALLMLDGGVRLLLTQSFDRGSGPVGKRFDMTASHALATPDNRIVKELGALPVMEAIHEKDGPTYVWLCATEISATDGQSYYLGYGTEYSIRRYTADGTLDRIIRRAWTPYRLTKADISTFVEEWLLRWSTKPGPEREKDRTEMLGAAYAINLPAYSAILADRTGKLWVRTPKPVDAAVAGFLTDYSIGPSEWSVFDPEGQWLGDVTMPARFMPSEIGTDYVLGVARDEDGVATVVRYKLGTQ